MTLQSPVKPFNLRLSKFVLSNQASEQEWQTAGTSSSAIQKKKNMIEESNTKERGTEHRV